MTKPATVTVIIPTFERPAATAEAIASALRQSRAPSEIIVVDDASARPFSWQPPVNLPPVDVRILRHSRNLGAGAARNTGIEAARGAFVAFLDSDDIWFPEKLERQLALLEPDADALRALACAYRKLGPRPGAQAEQRPIPAEDPRLFASGCWFCPGSTVVLPRTVFARVGLFDPTLRRLEDLDWYLRFALAGGTLSVSTEVLAEIRVGGRPSPAVLAAAAACFEHKLGEGEFSALPLPLKKRLRAYLALEQASAAFHAARAGSPALYAAMLGHLARSFLLQPRARLHLARFWEQPAPSGH